MELTPEERTTLTYKWDRLRGISQGILETCGQTFALLIAIRVFQAPDLVKGLLPAAFPFGFLLAPVTVYLAACFTKRLGTICAVYSCLGAVGLGIAVLYEKLWLFVVFIALAQICLAQITPLITHIYANNYSSRERGSRFATTYLIAALTGAAAAYAGGKLLDRNLSDYPFIFLVGSGAAMGAAIAFYRMPTAVMTRRLTPNPWENISLIWKDRVFGWILMAWMIMGLGNLMTFPIRIEYLANPAYGINATNEQIGIILGAVPLLARLSSVKFWGYLFDRWNMITLRTTLNLLIISSILIFFNTRSLWLITVASALFGLVLGGSRIMWQLWVTRIVPPEKVASYMSVHTSMTGLRGTAAPFLGYFLLLQTNPAATGWIGAVLVGFATLLFIPAKPIFEAHRIADPQN